MTDTANKINDFLKSSKKEIDLRFKHGYYIRLKKHTVNGNPFVEIHTSGYDDTLTLTESINWLLWELIDRDANGMLTA